MSKQNIRPEGGVPNSRYRRAGDLVFISGLVPEDGDGFLVGDDITTQTRRCFERIAEVLSSVGAGFEHVVKMNVFLAHAQRDFVAMNAVFREILSEPYPARSTVGAEIAAPGILIEIEAVAYVPQDA